MAVAAAAAAEQKPSEPLWKLKLKRVEEEFNDTNEKFGLLYEQHVQALQVLLIYFDLLAGGILEI